MAISDSLLAELEQEAVTTRKVLERVPQDKLAWKPHEKSMTLGYLATHIATTPGVIAEILNPDSVSMDDFKSPEVPTTTTGILEAFDQSLDSARAFLKGLDDARAVAIWRIEKDGKEMMSLPRVAFMRAVMFNHVYHHRGQLSVYLRLLNVPVPSIYGPSADENPWAQQP